MIKKFICLLAAAIVLSAPTVFAQEGAITSEGKLVLDKKTYALRDRPDGDDRVQLRRR